MFLLAPHLLGCASVIPQYEAAMERALADPGPTPDVWEPDAVLHISGLAINRVVKDAIEDYGTFSTELNLGVVQVSPDLLLSSMTVSEGRKCTDCLGVAIELDGKLRWTSSVLGEGSTRLAASGSLDARFSTMRSDEGDFVVSVQPTRFRFLDVTLGSFTVGVAGVGETIKDWIDSTLVAQVPPQEMMRIAQEDLPLADVRIVPDGDSVQLHMLTMSPERGRVVMDGPRPASGWRLDLAPESIVAIARAEAFKAGPMTRGIVAEPTLLTMDADSFEMGLRLWRSEGRGWWRDYTIHGTVSVEQDEIRLAATKVRQVAKSPGAGLTDPLVALAKGLILNYIEKAFETSIPAAQGEGTVVQIQAIQAIDGAIRSTGEILIEGEAGEPDATLVQPQDADVVEGEEATP